MGGVDGDVRARDVPVSTSFSEHAESAKRWATSLFACGHSHETPRAWWVQLLGLVELRLSSRQATILVGPAGRFVYLELEWGYVRETQ